MNAAQMQSLRDAISTSFQLRNNPRLSLYFERTELPTVEPESTTIPFCVS
jgi:hypothetical protein